MTRIFALVTVAGGLLLATAAWGAAYDTTESSDPLLDDILAIFGSGVDVALLVPLVLAVGLVIAVLGTMSQ